MCVCIITSWRRGAVLAMTGGGSPVCLPPAPARSRNTPRTKGPPRRRPRPPRPPRRSTCTHNTRQGPLSAPGAAEASLGPRQGRGGGGVCCGDGLKAAGRMRGAAGQGVAEQPPPHRTVCHVGRTSPHTTPPLPPPPPPPPAAAPRPGTTVVRLCAVSCAAPLLNRRREERPTWRPRQPWRPATPPGRPGHRLTEV